MTGPETLQVAISVGQIAFAAANGWILWRIRTRESIEEAKRTQLKAEIFQRLQDYPTAVEVGDLVSRHLAVFQVGFMKELNGTYVRSNEFVRILEERDVWREGNDRRLGQLESEVGRNRDHIHNLRNLAFDRAIDREKK